MSGPATLDELSTTVRTLVEGVGAKFTEPDDDWVPVMFVQSPDAINIVAMPLDLFSSGAAKDALAEALKQAMLMLGAYRFALLLNVHGIDLTAVDPAEAKATIERVREEEVRVEQLPGATEQLILIVGDAEGETSWKARIERHPDAPPTLAPWQHETAATSGRFAGLGQALRQVRA